MDKFNYAVLNFAESYRPQWFVSDITSHIPVPDQPWKPLPGSIIASVQCGNETIPLISEAGGKYYSQYDWNSWFNSILAEDYRQLARPLYTRLPFHYHYIPTSLRNLIYRFLLKCSNPSSPKSAIEPNFPGFPIEQGLEALNFIYETISKSDRNFITRNNPKTQIILTHDIDTKAGFQWVKDIAKLELAYGFRSIWFVVGHAYVDYRVDDKILDWLANQQFELGLHGYNHDNKLIFLSESRIRQRFDRCLPLIQRYGMQAFRSPSWFRNAQLFRVLRDYLSYDYSYLDSDIACPGGKGGCLWTKSFQRHGLTHIPTTVLYEAPLFFPELGQGHSMPDQLLQFWRPKLEWLQACGGNIVVITHPDPTYSGNPKMLRAYEALLAYLQQCQISA